MIGHDGGMFFGGTVMWVLWILAIVVIVVILKSAISSGSAGTATKGDSPLEILQKRYARGEIDEEEFNRRRKELEN